MSDLAPFLEKFVEGYLLSDLKTMAEIPAKDGPGNLGYPMVLAVFAGCELLGALRTL